MLRASYGQGFGPGPRCAVFIICKHRNQEAAASGNNGVQVGNGLPTFLGVPGMVRIPGDIIWVSFGGGCTRTALCPESLEQSGVRLSLLLRRDQPLACIDHQMDGYFSCDYDNDISQVAVASMT